VETVRYELDVTISNRNDECSYLNNFVPDTSEVILTSELIDKILKLNKNIELLTSSSNNMGCYKIVAFDESPSWLIEYESDDPSDPDVIPLDGEKIHLVSLEVYKESILWSGDVIKGDYVAHIETQAISISEIKEIDEIIATPNCDLPLWIEKVESAKGKELLERRLKK